LDLSVDIASHSKVMLPLKMHAPVFVILLGPQ